MTDHQQGGKPVEPIHYHLAEFETSFGNAAQFFASDMPEVVFAGRSNVGKSTLINKLCNRKSLARVSSTPGKTETINFYRLNRFRLVDLPGYGYAKKAKTRQDDWGALMDHYFNSDRDIRLVFLLWDIRHDPSELDKVMYDYLLRTDLPFVIVLTKADKLSKQEMAEVPARFEGMQQTVVPVSVNGMGIDTLKQVIETAISEERL